MLKKYGLNTILRGIVIVLLLLVLFKISPNYVIAKGDGGAYARHVFAVVGKQGVFLPGRYEAGSNYGL